MTRNIVVQKMKNFVLYNFLGNFYVGACLAPLDWLISPASSVVRGVIFRVEKAEDELPCFVSSAYLLLPTILVPL